jgi:predicted permease
VNADRSRCSWADVGYRLLLRSYPAQYRARFGGVMRETFLSDHARVREAGVFGLIPFWIVTAVQAVWFGARERYAGRSSSMKVSIRRLRRWPAFVLSDVSYALRLLVRSPIFTLASVMSLAIGIAGTTSVFALADALLFQDIPGVRQPDRVVQIARTTGGRGWGTMSPVVVERMNAEARQLDSIAALADPIPLSLADGASSERVWGWMASANFFDVVGVTPALGRVFRSTDDGIVSAQPVVVLSHRFWQERFGSDRSVLGRPFRLNGVPCVVIGVAARDFDGLTFVGGDLWVTTTAAPALAADGSRGLLTDPANFWLRAVGRLAEGATMASAHAELNAMMAMIKKDTPSIPRSHGIVVETLSRTPVPARRSFASFVALLFALTAGLLAIVCSNVAGMLLARATIRRREVATRLALGASRGRVIGQMLVETLVLFSIAGVCAIPLTLLLLHPLAGLLPTLPGPVAIHLTVTARGLVVAVGVSLATGLVFGLLPARYALQLDLSAMLHGHSSTTSRSRLRMRHVLVAAQVAVSLALVITAGVFVQSLHAASRADLGFHTMDVDVITLDTTLAGPAGADPRPLVTSIVDRVRMLDGIEAVGHAFRIPLVSGWFSLGHIRMEGSPRDESPGLGANWDVVSPDYFRAIRLPLVLGRDFTASDRDGRPDVAIVNETFARLASPGQPALGRRFVQAARRPQDDRVHEIIGIVRDSPYQAIGEAPGPVVYVPFAQHPRTHVELFVRHTPGRSRAADVRRAIAQVEPALPVVAMRSFEEATALALLPRRAAASVAGGGGAVGVYLSALGLYGLIAFVFAQRSREFALRIALGASPAQIKALVLGQALRLGVAGCAIGFGLAAALGFIIRAQGPFIDVPVVDPLIFSAAGLFIAAVLLGTALLTARRALSIDPVQSLRAD